MTHEKHSRAMVSIGLNDIEKIILETAVSEDAEVRHLAYGRLLEELDIMDELGGMLWIPWRFWKYLSEEHRQAVNKHAGMHKFLILDKNHEGPDFEQALAQGFTDVIVSPLTQEKIIDAVHKATEAKDLFDDIMRMAKEISLEREILTRKTDALLFLNRIMTRAVESLNPVTIMNKAREDLNLLFPVRAVQGIFWQNSGKSAVEAEIFLAFHNDTAIQDTWLEMHLAQAGKISGREVHGYQLTYLMGSDSGGDVADMKPEADKTLALPLKAGGEHFGCLTILAGSPLRLSRDQSEVLRSATNHLGLALKNALLFRETKIRADYDGLTRIYNRHFFDDRLTEEISRHKRYQHDLSLMILDLDHFKAVNDTYGHQAGDMVLKEVGQILLDGIRNTDFAARYGGEEFVVILPHIAEKQAHLLAGRLAEKIAAKRFEHGGKLFNVTVSAGVASLDPAVNDTAQELLRRADQALYQAKADGRDRVLAYSELIVRADAEEAQQM